MHSMMKTSALFSAFLLLAACSPGDAAEKAAAGNRSLVGDWHTTLPLQGRATEVVWQARADGSCTYRVAAASIPCRWKLQGDVLQETAEDGSSSSAKLQWTGDDRMTLIIIDNGRPAEKGTRRQYVRR